MSKIYVWGIGNKTKEYMNWGLNIKKIDGFIDSYAFQNEYEGKPVYKPEYLVALQKEEKDIIVIVASSFAYEIKQKCEGLHIDMRNFVFTKTCFDVCEANYHLIKNIFPELYSYLYEYKTTPKFNMELDYIDDRKEIGEDPVYILDYFRYRTFELIADQIKSNCIEGETAELGVFKGKFARVINKNFPDKYLYLFDTFNGFDEDEALNEVSLGRCDERFAAGFKNTTIDKVMAEMSYPERVIIKQGLFPDTTKDMENDKYCFVSLDVDFEESTYLGLKYFYPRLSEGGYIMVHDCNSHLRGVSVAIRRFEEVTGIKLKMVPIADHYGTMVIIK